jgi:transposase
VLPKKAKRLDDADLLAFQARYREGATIAMLAQEFGVHRTTVMAFTKRLDLHRPICALSDPQIQQAAALYQHGESLSEVAKRYGVGVETMRTALLAVGQELRPRGRPRREATRV